MSCTGPGAQNATCDMQRLLQAQLQEVQAELARVKAELEMLKSQARKVVPTALSRQAQQLSVSTASFKHVSYQVDLQPVQ